MLEDGVLPSLLVNAYAGSPVDQPRLAAMPPLKSNIVVNGESGGGGGAGGGDGGDGGRGDGGGGGGDGGDNGGGEGGDGWDGGDVGRFRKPTIPAPPMRKRLGVPAAMAFAERTM